MGRRSWNISEVRKDFPILRQPMNGKSLVYLDTAASAQKPQCVIETIAQFYAKEYATVHRGVYEHSIKATERYAGVRRKVREFLGAASEDEIIFTRGTTESINLIAATLGEQVIHEGDEILITEMEHHANILPWQVLATRKKARLRVAKVDEEGNIDLVAFRHLLSSKTKIVSFAHVSNVLGTMNPIKEMTTLAHEYNAYVIIDGAQAVPHLIVDVVDINADFYAFSSHKLYGPTGVGVLYGKKAILDKMPPYQVGGSMVEAVTFDRTIYQDAPAKFEAGTPMIAGVLGLGVALDYITSFDRCEMATYEDSILCYALQELEKISGLHVLGQPQHRIGVITFTIDGVHTFDLGTFLSLKGIAIRTGTLCAQPILQRFGWQGAARMSVGLYNTREEVDSLIAAILETTSLLLTS